MMRKNVITIAVSLCAMLLVIAANDDEAGSALLSTNNNNNKPAVTMMLQGNPAPAAEAGKASFVNKELLAGKIGSNPARSGVAREAEEAAAVAMQSAMALLGAKQKSTPQRKALRIPRRPIFRSHPPAVSKRAAVPTVQLATPKVDKTVQLRNRLQGLKDRLRKLQQIRAAAPTQASAAAVVPPKPDLGREGGPEEEAMAWGPIGNGVAEAQADLGIKVQASRPPTQPLCDLSAPPPLSL